MNNWDQMLDDYCHGGTEKNIEQDNLSNEENSYSEYLSLGKAIVTNASTLTNAEVADNIKSRYALVDINFPTETIQTVDIDIKGDTAKNITETTVNKVKIKKADTKEENNIENESEKTISDKKSDNTTKKAEKKSTANTTAKKPVGRPKKK